MFSYFSVSCLRFARPASKSFPIILSKFMNTCITLDINDDGPCITQVMFVAYASRSGTKVNSAVL